MWLFRQTVKVAMLMMLTLVWIQPTFADDIIWNTVVLERPDGSVIYNKIEEEGSYENPTWGRNSNEVLFTLSKGGYESDYGNLYVMETKKGRVRPLTHEDNRSLRTGNSHLYQDDGIYFVEEQNEVPLLRKIDVIFYAFSLESEWCETLDFPRWVDVGNPCLSPDGEWLVFDGTSDEELVDGTAVRQIYKMSKTTGEVIQLTDNSHQKRRPRWSPDGYLLLYEQYDDQFREWSIYVTDFTGKYQRRLTSSMGNETYGSFSPDSAWIVYSGDEDLEGEVLEKNKLFIQSVYSSEIIQLTEDRFYDTRPSWSPDGKRIVFQTSPKTPESYGMSWIAIKEVPDLYEENKE
jgi:Tol biopolymer transport system component